MISKNVLNILPEPLKAYDEHGLEIEYDLSKLSEVEQFAKGMYDKFKVLEFNTYKDIHKEVLLDDGLSKLKKTGFRMPGYRKIICNL